MDFNCKQTKVGNNNNNFLIVFFFKLVFENIFKNLFGNSKVEQRLLFFIQNN